MGLIKDAIVTLPKSILGRILISAFKRENRNVNIFLFQLTKGFVPDPPPPPPPPPLKPDDGDDDPGPPPPPPYKSSQSSIK